MNGPDADDIRVFIETFLNRKLQERGAKPLPDLPEDFDLLMSGVLDSLAFVEMITEAGKHFAHTIDLEGLEPEKMTFVGPLCTYVSDQLRKGA